MKNHLKASSFDAYKEFIDLTGVSPDADVERKSFSSLLAISPDETMTFVTNISVDSLDRDDEVIMPKGIRTDRYEKNPVVMWQHSYDQPPVGKVIGLQKHEHGLVAKIKMASTERAKELWQLVKDGMLNAQSIGFLVNKAYVRGTVEFDAWIKETGSKIPEGCRRVLADIELLETSIVPIPSCPDALNTAVSAKAAVSAEAAEPAKPDEPKPEPDKPEPKPEVIEVLRYAAARPRITPGDAKMIADAARRGRIV